MSHENSTIIALIFSKTKISNQIYEGVHRLHNDGTLEVLDVCEFDVKENRKIRFERAMTLPLIGSTDELFLEAFVGLIFFHAPHSHNVEHAISEIHLDQNFIQQLNEKALPGSSVLFIHAKNQPALSNLKSFAEEASQILSTQLSAEQQSQLEMLFHGGPSSEATSADLSLH
jgi:uncharacterized membrane protein